MASGENLLATYQGRRVVRYHIFNPLAAKTAERPALDCAILTRCHPVSRCLPCWVQFHQIKVHKKGEKKTNKN